MTRRTLLAIALAPFVAAFAHLWPRRKQFTLAKLREAHEILKSAGPSYGPYPMTATEVLARQSGAQYGKSWLTTENLQEAVRVLSENSQPPYYAVYRARDGRQIVRRVG
jgi:hypothetical protein